jgi:excisionase family DNA binding protein
MPKNPLQVRPTTLPSHQNLTVWEVAHHLRVSATTIYDLVAAGDLPAIRVGKAGKTIRIPREQFLTWYNKSVTGGEEER